MFDASQESFINLKKTLAENTAPVYMWIGAGLSVPAGLPTWEELRNQMILRGRKCLEKQEESKDRNHRFKLLDAAETSSDLWAAFDYIHDAIGESEYQRLLQAIFQLAVTCKVPDLYCKICGLNIRGVVTTNIDKLMSKAYYFSDVKSQRNILPKEFTGKECRSYTYVLSTSDFFILHLHGHIDNSASLVMRKNDIEALSKDEGYIKFIRTLFYSKVMVLVGVNPYDPSITQHLYVAKASGACGTPMYWITPENSEEALCFCDKYGIQRIIYSAENGHKELDEAVNLLCSGKSEDEILTKPGLSNIPRVEQSIRNFDEIDLKSKSSDEVRNLLNKKAFEILRPGTIQCYERYEEFLSKYKREIHNSWYLEPGENLFGLSIEEEIGDGAFGRVFRASDKEGNIVAVKLLKSDLMRKPDCIQSFRRGVRAMEILAKKNVSGVVQYRFASEIPACVAMEYIDGVNLHKLVEQGRICDWKMKMRILVETAGIIKMAHSLPERVLHRDIRPQNIMLKGYDYCSEDWSVCVLDFDLAFHKDANEVSMQMASAINGYLAPEQTDRSGRYGTTRSSRVDSYGFAMLCYYVITGRAPMPGQCFRENWSAQIFNDVCVYKAESWISLPYVMSRIIDSCTKSDQNARMDLYKVYEYLSALLRALRDSESMRIPELLLDELACLVASKIGLGCAKGVKLDNSGHRLVQCPDGQLFNIYLDGNGISIETSWHNAGNTDYARAKHIMSERAISLVTRLQKLKCKDVSHHFEGAGVVVSMKCDLSGLSHGDMINLANVLNEYRIYPKGI